MSTRVGLFNLRHHDLGITLALDAEKGGPVVLVVFEDRSYPGFPSVTEARRIPLDVETAEDFAEALRTAIAVARGKVTL